MTAPLDPIRTELAEARAEVIECMSWAENAAVGRVGSEWADVLLTQYETALRAEAAAEALEAAIREDRTTVAKLSPVESLTCFLVKAEDLVARAAALSAVTSREPS